MWRELSVRIEEVASGEVSEFHFGVWHKLLGRLEKLF
jgi:hypothetical protein